MQRRTFILTAAGIALLAAGSARAETEVEDLPWIELLPGGGAVARPVPLEEHNEGGNAMLLNDADVPIREDLDGRRVRMVGYVTPIAFAPGSRSMRVSGFLLAPFTGACVHVPPPPANQLILGNYPEGIQLATRLSLDPVMVVGTLSAGKTSVDVTVAGYQLAVESMEYFSDERSSNADRFTWGAN